MDAEAVLPHLQAFYAIVAPKFAKLAPKILASHRDREAELFEALAVKYGQGPVDTLIADIRAAAHRTPGPAPPPAAPVAPLAMLGAVSADDLQQRLSNAMTAEKEEELRQVLIRRLRAFYEQNAPKFAKLAAKILGSYKGREAELFDQLAVKYGQGPVDELVADVLRLLSEVAERGRGASDAAAQTPQAAQAASAVDLVEQARAATQADDVTAAAGAATPAAAPVAAAAPADASNRKVRSGRTRHDEPVWRRLREMGSATPGDADGTTVLVAVRVRPLNRRERSLGAGTGVEVKNTESNAGGGRFGGQVVLSGAAARAKSGSYSFNFDMCLDSSRPPPGPAAPARDDGLHVSQARVFAEVGTLLLANAWAGFNVCLFAYGQTGSGKSFTMAGERGEQHEGHPEAGIIPRLCRALFEMIATKQRRNERAWRRWRVCQGHGPVVETGESSGSDDGEDEAADTSPLCSSFLVEASYLEIYSERVRDLLNPVFGSCDGGAQLRVREHPKTGVFVEGLTREPVKSFVEVEALMDDGMSARAIASTAMNETSSRSHCIFTLHVSRKDTPRQQDGTGEEGGSEDSKTQGSLVTSKINLIDLAGSEDQRTTGAQGQRLKEGAQINKSLSSLGLCIAALARQSQTVGDAVDKKSKRTRSLHVPFRDSVLTWLLKESLGGNSKTVMLATISPSDACFSESLSTLRYAERAKKVRTNATVNKTDANALIEGLRAQVAALQSEAVLLRKRAMDAEQSEDRSASARAENVASAIAATGAKLVAFDFSTAGHDATHKRMMQSQQKRRATLAAAMGNRALPPAKLSSGKDTAVAHCYLALLSDDAAQCGLVRYSLSPGKTLVGSEGPPASEKAAHIRLTGLAIAPCHVVIERVDTAHVLVPSAQRTRLTLRVGSPDAATFVNGTPLAYNDDESFHADLNDGDRIVLGACRHLYLVCIQEIGAPAHKRASTVQFNDAVRELATGCKESEEGRRSRLMKSALKQWRLPVATQIFEDELVSACRVVAEVSGISTQMEQPLVWNVALVENLGQQIGVFALNELVSYQTVQVEIVVTLARSQSDLPEHSPWRVQVCSGESGSTGTVLFRCKLAAFQDALASLRELFGRYADFCVQVKNKPVLIARGKRDSFLGHASTRSIRRKASMHSGRTHLAADSFQAASDAEDTETSNESDSSDSSDADSLILRGASSPSDESNSQARFHLLFSSFDAGGDGMVDRDDLIAGLRRLTGSDAMESDQSFAEIESEVDHILERYGGGEALDGFQFAHFVENRMGAEFLGCFEEFVVAAPKAEDKQAAAIMRAIATAAVAARSAHVAAAGALIAASEAASIQQTAGHTAAQKRTLAKHAELRLQLQQEQATVQKYKAGMTIAVARADDAEKLKAEALATQERERADELARHKEDREHEQAFEAKRQKQLADELAARSATVVCLQQELVAAQALSKIARAEACGAAAEKQELLEKAASTSEQAKRAQQQAQAEHMILKTEVRERADELARHKEDREHEQALEAKRQKQLEDQLVTQLATSERLQKEVEAAQALSAAAQADIAAVREAAKLELGVALGQSASASKVAVHNAVQQAQEVARTRHAALEQQLAEKAAHAEQTQRASEALERRKKLLLEHELASKQERIEKLAAELAEAEQRAQLNADTDAQAEEMERQLNALSIQLDAQQAASVAHHAAYEDVVTTNIEAQAEVELLKGQLAEKVLALEQVESQQRATSSDSRAQAEERLKAQLGERTRELVRHTAQAEERAQERRELEQRLSAHEATIESLRGQLELAVEQAKDQEDEEEGSGMDFDATTLVYTKGKMRQRRLFAERMPPALLVGCTVLVAGFGEGTVVGFKKGQLLGLGASPHTIEFSSGAGTIHDPAHVETKKVVLARHGNGRTPFVIEAMPGHSDLWQGDEEFNDGSDLAASPSKKQLVFMCGGPQLPSHARRQTDGGEAGGAAVHLGHSRHHTVGGMIGGEGPHSAPLRGGASAKETGESLQSGSPVRHGSSSSQ